MKAIICGAGDVGRHIARYLSEEKNQVVLIDTDKEILKQVESSLDVQTIEGPAHSPEILEQAGAKDADMLIAVTSKDEINMVTCVEAGKLFSIPLKIARLRSGFYSSGNYADLLEGMQIDVVISPEQEVAKLIMDNLQRPGTTSFIPMRNQRVIFVGAKCQKGMSLKSVPLDKLSKHFPDKKVSFVRVLRDGQNLPISGENNLKIGDDVYFITQKETVNDVLSALGNETKQTRKIIVFGGGRVGYNFARLMENEGISTKLTIVEKDERRALYLAKHLEDVQVIKGDALEEGVLQEIDIDAADAAISLTGKDEENIFLSFLAKQFDVQHTFAVVNRPIYNSLISHLGVDVVINPNAAVISTILQHIRKGSVQSVHSVRPEIGELMEFKSLETSKIVGIPFKKIRQYKGVQICAVARKGQMQDLTPDFLIEKGDDVWILAEKGCYKNAEKMFSAGLFFF